MLAPELLAAFSVAALPVIVLPREPRRGLAQLFNLDRGQARRSGSCHVSWLTDDGYWVGNVVAGQQSVRSDDQRGS